MGCLGLDGNLDIGEFSTIKVTQSSVMPELKH